MGGKPLSLILLLAFSIFASHSNSLPLSTNNRWIIDETGKRVKLHCVNWSSHLNAMVAEGLEIKPLKDLIAQLKELGFDCVRYTWATHMFTRYSNYKVGENLDKLNLTSSRLGIGNFNPSLENITVVEAFDFVIDEFGKQGMMVLVDNHVSDPKWCCHNKDGNGFFGDQYSDPKEWLQGLSNVANRVKGKSQVVAVGLRNELRGPGQNIDNWQKYMSQGATTVHKENPNVLVFVSGFNYDTDLSFLKTNPLNTSIGDKLVYEVHSYAWSTGSPKDWIVKPLNQKCANVMNGLNDRAGFLMSGSNPNPLVMSEFGLDMTDMDDKNQRFLSCMLAYLAGVDLDWALWTAQGSYYIREKESNVSEHYGLWNIDFKSLRYPDFPQRFQLVQKKLLEPSSNSSKSYVIYHPLSGQCVKVNTNNELELGDCEWASKWNQEGQQIKLVGNGTYIEAVSDGSQVKVSNDCKSKQSFWKTLSATNLHLGTLDEQGQNLCLQRESTTSPKIVTKKCICIDDNPACLDDPQSQWFQLVTTNV
ncbi:hydrolyzing O-glycosyl compounds hydrolase [Medicago truncatula]|uniref:Hydrolyzing O-glycosyl compounds hydrolase n=2 Tax=Medicago truncatula TaxID=3880 RepID=G7L487_MEDTR|nr:hydrolyzing O-glycosyl compounds hydrolase [Medicago truncatula]